MNTTSTSTVQPSANAVMRPSRARDLDELAGLLSGTLSRPGDPTWDAARATWQLLVDQQPLAVVEADNDDDVVVTVRTAATLGLRVAAQSTGHNAAPLGDLSRTVVVRTGALEDISIDAEARVAHVGAGARWGDLQAAASAAGLTGIGGFSDDVGVVGLLLGGGLGWFSRSHGMASSTVRGFSVVTPDGVVRRIDPFHDEELFSAVVRGADVAIILSVDIELYVIDELAAGALFWPASCAPQVFEAWSEWTTHLPETVTSVVRLLSFPDVPGVPADLAGRRFAMVEFAAQLPPADVDALLEPLRALAPQMATVARMAAQSLGALHMDPPQPTATLSAGMVVGALPPDTLDALVHVLMDGEAQGLTSVELRHLGGALDRDARSALAGARALMFAVAVVPPPSGARDQIGPALDAARAGLDAVTNALRSVACQQHMRSFSEAATDSRLLWGDDLAQLRALKRRWDPLNLIHANHSVLTGAQNQE